jgi:hypothetical protein
MGASSLAVKRRKPGDAKNKGDVTVHSSAN